MSTNPAKLFSKHIVGFTWLDYPNSSSDKIPARLHCLTGFVINIEDHWFLIMAGHCMKSFEELVNSGKRSIDGVTLVDDYLTGTGEGIPFADRTNPDWRFCVDDKDGADCGFLRLTKNEIQLLKSKKIVPIDVREFSIEERVPFQSYAVLGFPSESIDLSITPSTMRSPLALVFTPLERISPEEIPTYYSNPSLDNVGINYAHHYRITEIGTLKDFDGISGGPVFGFNKNPSGGFNFNLVGVQTGWKKSQSRVFTTPAIKCGAILFMALKNWGISVKQITTDS